MPAGNHVVVLAAGRGSRLLELGDDRAKWLLEVDGRTIAERQLEGVARAAAEAPGAVRGVLVVTGHAPESIDAFLAASPVELGGVPVRTVFNEQWATLNNWFSLLVGLRALPADEEGVVVCNSDLYAQPGWYAEFLRAAHAHPAELLIAVDRERELTDESMKVTARPGADGADVVRTIHKGDFPDAIGEYVGLLRARGAGLAALREALEAFEGDPGAANEWYEGAVGRTAAAGADWVVWDTPGTDWVEIDDRSDHAAAGRLARA